MKILLKDHVQDPETGQTHYRGVQEIDDDAARRLLAAYPESVLDPDGLSGKNKDELVQVAEEVGVEVKGDTKADVEKKLGKK